MLSVLVSVALILATSAAAMAQSGRGRQLRIQETLRGEVSMPLIAEIAEVQAKRRSCPPAPTTATVETRKHSALIYHDATSNQKKDSGNYHMTKGKKGAGWILLGLLVVGVAVMIANDGDF